MIFFPGWILLLLFHSDLSHIYTYLLTIFYFYSYLSKSLSSLFFSHFFDRYKNGTPCAPTLASRCLVSFVPFSTRFGFALRAFNLFAPSPCMSMCIRLCVCVFALLCVCQLLILYKHTHACALAHILTHIDGDGKRGTLRRWVEERQRWRERERKKITLYIGAQDGCYAVRLIYDCWG